MYMQPASLQPTASNIDSDLDLTTHVNKKGIPVWETRFIQLVQWIIVLWVIGSVALGLAFVLPAGIAYGVSCGHMALCFGILVTATLILVILYIWQHTHHRMKCDCKCGVTFEERLY